MEFQDFAALIRSRLDHLVGVVIHCLAASRALHRFIHGYEISQLLQFYVFSPVAECGRHPDEFGKELVDSSQKGCIYQISPGVEDVLHV